MNYDQDLTLNIIGRKKFQEIKAEEGDYIKDGFLYCGKCHTPKQYEITLTSGRTYKPLTLCKCMEEKRKAEEEEIERIKFQERVKTLRKEAFPEADMQSWDFANDDRANEKISNVSMNYVKNFDEMKKRGKGLLFFGNVGTGKTYYSACIVNSLVDKGYPCLMTSFTRLSNTISGMFQGKQEYIDSLNKYDLIVLDDLASERDTEYMNEIVNTIIDNRYRAGLPTIVTTNLTAEEIQNPAEIHKQRTFSRLLGMCLPVKVEGVDRRREKLKTDFKELNELLGL